MNKIDGITFLISIYGGHLGFQNGRHSIIKPVFLNILEIKRAREFISTANPIIGINKTYVQSLKKQQHKSQMAAILDSLKIQNGRQLTY